MKKIFILIILPIIICTSLITAASYCYVSGNTFTIPSDNKGNKSYYTYKIDKNTDSNKNRKNNNKKNNTPKSSIQNNNTDNNNIHYNNTQNNNTNNKSNNNNSNNKPKNNYNKNTNINHNISKFSNKKTKPDYNKKNNNPSRKKNLERYNSNIIKKIEFQKHFIKIQAGSSENILFTTTPAKSSHTGLIYKSNNNSVAVYKNNKLTGIKKGFTTILIMLKDGTVKAACPVKVI